jgi:hypothetical protein
MMISMSSHFGALELNHRESPKKLQLSLISQRKQSCYIVGKVSQPRKISMKLLAFLAEAFINTFGITQPQPEQQRKIHLILGGFILTVIVLAFGTVGFLVYTVTTGNR